VDLTIINVVVSWGAVILIWLVQLVHYPTFRYIDADQFQDFHQHHTHSITLIVMPLMLIELGLAIYLMWQSNFGKIEIIAFALVVGVWLSTFLIQIPLHHALSDGKNLTIIDKLVASNWWRTFLWTVKALLLSWFVN